MSKVGLSVVWREQPRTELGEKGEWVNSFPKAVVTNYLQPVAEHNRNFFSHRSGGPKSACPSESLGEDLGLLLPALVPPGISWLTAALLQSLPVFTWPSLLCHSLRRALVTGLRNRPDDPG